MNTIGILMAMAVMGVLGLILGVMLTVAAKKFEVETDPRIELVRAALPGANCGACGYVGCDDFAEAVANGEAPHDGCIPGGVHSADAIKEIMQGEMA